MHAANVGALPLPRAGSEAFERLHVVEDASQAFGARRDGKPAGSFGVAAAISMNPMKVLAACGEAGVVVADDEDLLARLAADRYNGMIVRERCRAAGLNWLLDTIQAAILLERLRRFDDLVSAWRRVAGCYGRRLAGAVETPPEDPGAFDVFYTYTIRTERRDELVRHLAGRGVQTWIHYPILMPLQEAHRGRCRGEYPRARCLVSRILSLPCHEKMSDGDARYVASRVLEFCGT